MRQEKFLGIPERENLKRSLLLAMGFLLLFYLVFGVCDLLASQRGFSFDIAMPWEKHIPLLDWTALVYLTIGPVMLLGPFVIRDPVEFRRAVNILTFELLLAAPLFVIFPAMASYPAIHAASPFSGALALAGAINLDYNEVPSLHVAFAVTTAWLFSRNKRGAVKIGLGVWAAALCLSTLTTHQHNVIGVITGLVLAMTVLRVNSLMRQRACVPGTLTDI